MECRPLTIFRIPKYKRLQSFAERYPTLGLDPAALEAYLMLLGVAGEVSAAVSVILSRYGVAEGRLHVLALLLEHDPHPLSHSELAELSAVTKGNITGLVDGLERDGYVKRQESITDRRVTPIALTPSGRRLVEEILPDLFSRIAGLMGELSVSERQSLVSLMTKILAAVPVFQGE